jgi:hypothetical protein
LAALRADPGQNCRKPLPSIAGIAGHADSSAHARIGWYWHGFYLWSFIGSSPNQRLLLAL